MINLKNVSFLYNRGQSNQIRALSNIDLCLQEGEFVSILGPNGSGKSTLAHLLNALLVPSEGEIIVDGISTSEKDVIPIRKKVGLLFQNPDSQIVATIVEEDVAFGPENIGLDPEEINKRINESLEAVDLQAYRNYEPHSLSVGQRQKVALASTLAMEPKYLVLDEPTSYLDPGNRKEMLQLFKEINQEKNMAVINVTHYPEQVLLSERVIVLNEGKVIFDGEVDEFYQENDVLKLLGIEKPLWLTIKDKYQSEVKGLENVNSTEGLADILCSSS